MSRPLLKPPLRCSRAPPSLTFCFKPFTVTPKEEEYIHLAECSECLNDAWRILQELRTGNHNPVIHDAAFRFALVSYAKSYTRSDGVHKRSRDAYRLSTPRLSREEITLHEEIIRLRNQALAHADLTMKDAIVSLGRFDGRANICIAQNCPDPLPSIDAVISLIEHTLNQLYVDKAQLLDSLAPTD